MRLVVFGPGGNIGQRIVAEAVKRGNDVTAVAREKGRVPVAHARLRVVTGDVLDPASVAAIVKDRDAVISAIGPSRGTGPQVVVEAARSLIAGLARAGVRRLVVVGGAGSLEVAPGVQLVDTPNFPKEWRPIALAHRDALAIYQTADLDWTYVSPPALIEPGQRTGKYRTGTDRLLTDEKGESRMSIEDYAVALLDEVEKPRFVRQRMTVAY